MKKLLCLLLMIILCISLAACGAGTEKNTENNTITNTSSTEESSNNASNETIEGDNDSSYNSQDFGTGTVLPEEDESKEESGKKVEKTIDAVAEALGLTGGEKNFYDKIGAIDGKEYNGGNVVLYQYDVTGEKYQEILNGNGSSRIAAYKDGIVLLFPVGSTTNYELVNAFNALEFK